MPRELAQLDMSRRATRVVVIAGLLVAGAWSMFAFRWYLGNTLAEYFNTQLNDVEIARLAVSLAPGDPLTHWRLGQVYQQKLPLDQQQQVIAEFQTAARLSPNDYRLWTSLGTAYEHSEDPIQAERALRQAVALAPSYAYPHWYLGNLFLRSGRYDEAFSELRFACDADPELRPELFNIVFQINGNDLEAMKKEIGPSSESHAEFAQYLLTVNRADDGLLVWNGLNDQQKKEFRNSGNAIMTKLLELKRFHDAVNVWNSLTTGVGAHGGVEEIVDGGFEEPLSHGAEVVFGWRLTPTPQMQLSVDSNRGHDSSRSLRLVFQAHNKLDAINVSQLVPVNSSTQYQVDFYVRTNKLQTATPPFVQVLDVDGTMLGQSAVAPTGDNEWTSVSFSFKSGSKTEAVTIRVAREACAADDLCPIFGTVWYDDFSIKRTN